ncbi:MAG: NBR1-Ig-like domain-containing protein [Chloroflexota bacterium]
MTRKLIYLVSGVLILSTILSACNLPSFTVSVSEPTDQQTGVDQTAVAQTVAAAQMTSVPPLTEVPTIPPGQEPPPGPGPTSPPLPPTSVPSVPSPTPFCDRAQFVSETVPDGSDYLPGAAFTKTWRLRNFGTCTWTTGYAVVFDHGDAMGAPATVNLTGNVAPGQEVDISINMQAPATPGTYTGYWKLRTASSVLFGLGESANQAFWVQIDVVPPTPTATNIIIGPIFPLPVFPLFPADTEQILDQVTINAGAVGSSTATCPSGSVVVSGGYAVSANMLVYTQSMNGNGWRVYAKNNAGSSQLLNVYAICLRNTPGTVSQVHTQVSVPVGDYGNPVVSCPAGSVVTGGGYASQSDGSLWVYNSTRSGNGWQVYARNTSGAAKLVNVYAICLSGTTGTTAQVLQNVSISASSTGTTQAACPAGGLVTGGGFALQNDLIVYNSSMVSGDGNSWQAFARNTGGSSRTMNVYAICLSFP